MTSINNEIKQDKDSSSRCARTTEKPHKNRSATKQKNGIEESKDRVENTAIAETTKKRQHTNTKKKQRTQNTTQKNNKQKQKL